MLDIFIGNYFLRLYKKLILDPKDKIKNASLFERGRRRNFMLWEQNVVRKHLVGAKKNKIDILVYKDHNK
jgi:hypothetical protein